MPFCIVTANPKRAPEFGTDSTLVYDDPEYGPREYQGARFGNYWVFVIEVSNTELTRISNAPLQGGGGRKYGQKDDDGPWYVSFNPNHRYPGTRLSPVLRPDQQPNATARVLTETDLEFLDESPALAEPEKNEVPALATLTTSTPRRELTQFISDVTACQRCTKRWPGVLNQEPMPPRGFAGSLDVLAPVPLMLVSLNPGHPLPAEEALWSGKPFDSSLGEGLFSQCASYYDAGATPFHRISVAIVRAALSARGDDIPASEWAKHAWLTDAFKCSTPAEVGPRIPERALRECAFGAPREADLVPGHLEREIAILRPQVILTLGRRARELLLSSPYADRVVPFTHPSGAFHRLDSERWDETFRRIADLFGRQLPADKFRAQRTRIWEEAWKAR